MIIMVIAVCTTVLILMARELKDHEACRPMAYRCTYCGRPLPTEYSLAGQPICAACHEEDERIANLDAFEREC